MRETLVLPTGTEQIASETRLKGRRLAAARVGWVLVVVWILASFVRSLPGQLSAFQHPSSRSTELAPEAVAALQRVGVSLDVYAWVAVGFGSLIVLVATALAVLLFLRRGDDWLVWLASLLFPAYCFQSIGPSEWFTAPPSGSPLDVAATVLIATVTFSIIYAVFMLFPSGRFVPRWSWALLLACVVWIAAITAEPTLVVLFVGYPLFLGAAVACQVYRYRRISTPVQCLQTRWAVFGLITALLANQVFWIGSGTPLGKTIFPPLAYLALYGSVLLIPVTFFIAVQRHRLYEIDVLVRRTLIYGTLTAVLAALYYAVVLGAQAVARGMAGDVGQQPIVIVATTPLIAVLFAPLHQRIQVLIDRTFYRSRYDVARTLTAFGAMMRMETDLEEQCDHLVGVIHETMRPAHVTLWLRAPSDVAGPRE